MKEGERYKGFVVQKRSKINEIQVEILKLEHEKSGAQVFHIINDDEENVFSLAFKTYPKNDKGVAHILEHTVLCGSKKYPVRDPFFLMTRRSLNTFMNALTSKIWTAYPAASMNKQDFYNLLDVYLDATLYPLLRKESFFQEASRLEFDEEKKLTFKGVVFNEMKGSLANPYSRLFKETESALFGSNPYGSDSGGDPKAIVDLTHEELVEFHKTYYHPSRCLFYFYGNIPTTEHLDALDEKVFSSLLTKKEAISPLDKIAPFSEPKIISCSYPGTKMEGQKQDFIAFSWVMMDIDQQEDLLALTLLDAVLMQTDASPLKHELNASGYCQNADSMLDADTKQIPYTIIANGCDVKDFEKLKIHLFKTLEKLSKKPFDPKLIEASLTALEVERTEISSGSSPYGLELFYRSVLPYMQGASYIKPLQVHALFKKLKKNLLEPNYLQNYIKKYFLDNKHFVALNMKLDEAMQDKDKQEEEQKLFNINKLLSNSQIQEINAVAKALKKEQEEDSSKDKALLPGLTLEAIEKNVPYFPLKHLKMNSFDTYFHDCFCNHFVYLDICMPLINVSQKDLHDLTLLTSFITDVGSKNTSYKKRLIKIQNTFSSLSCAVHLNVQKDHLNALKPAIVISASILARKSKEACNLLYSILVDNLFDDNARIKELILSLHANLQNSMSSQALSLALKESSSGFNSYANLKNHLGGLPFIQYIDKIVGNLDQEVERLKISLNALKEKIFHFHEIDIVISGQNEHYEELISHKFYNLKNLKKSPFTPFIILPEPKKIENRINLLTLPIAHNALAVQSIDYTHELSGALFLASYCIKNKILHTEIREKGGAYGSGAKYSPLTALFQFYSYRDPNISRTYKMFKKACELILKEGFSDEELLEAKLGLFSDTESKVPPAARAYNSYANEMSGLDLESRNNYKQKVLTATKKDVLDAINEHLLPRFKDGCFVSYANESMAHTAQKEFDAPLELIHPFSTI